MEILQNFVAFSEYMNFTKNIISQKKQTVKQSKVVWKAYKNEKVTCIVITYYTSWSE